MVPSAISAAAVTRLGHATFATPDLMRMSDFYVDVIGLRMVDRSSTQIVLSSRCGDVALVLKASDHASCEALSFIVASRHDLAAIAARLNAQGVRVRGGTDAMMGAPDSIWFVDPKGTRITLSTTSQGVAHAPSAAAAGIGVLKLGHVAFASTMTKAITDFYVETLGFRVSDWVSDIFAFLRCGPDHHTVNFLTSETTRLHHIAYELQDWSHVLRACDELGMRNIPLIWGPGRHRVGHNLFVYHRDPDDHVVELYAELDQMKSEALGYFEPRPWHEHKPQYPRVWTREEGLPLWGPPPTDDFRRAGQAHLQVR